MCEHLYGNTNNYITVRIYDNESNLSYDVGISSEDKERAETDIDFFGQLLKHCKEHYRPNQNDEILDDNTQNNTEESSSSNDKTCWSFESITALINTVDSLRDELNDPRKRKKVWQNVANILISQKLNFNADVCSRKWRNLWRTYKSCKDNISKTGRGPIRFQYFKMMDEILGDQPNITSPHSINISSLTADAPTNQKDNDTPTNIVNDNPLKEITNLPTTSTPRDQNPEIVGTPLSENKEIVGTPLSENKNKRKNANVEYFKGKKQYFESKKEAWTEKREYKKSKDNKILELMNRKLILEGKVKALEDLVSIKNLETQNRMNL